MKTTKNIIANKYALVSIILLCTLGITSCLKDNFLNEQENPSEQNQLIIQVSGISAEEDKTIKSKLGSGASKIETGANSIDLVESEGFDAVIAIDNNNPSTEESFTNRSGLKASIKQKAAYLPLENNITYRIYLYKNNGGAYTFHSTKQFTQGTNSSMSVPNGSYKWVALSYNNNDSIPEAGASNDLTLPENKDVLYATSGSNDIIVNNNTPAVSIIFNRLYARIAIEFNTIGMFAPINSATISVSGQNSKGATLNLLSGTLNVAPTGVTPQITEVDFNNINGDASRKVAYFYTADETPQNLSITVTNLKIQLDNDTERNFGSTTLNQTKSITPQRGKNHRFLVGITESALTYEGVKWSRSNLYYKPNDATPYRFYHTNPQTNDPNSYFSFGAHRPRVLASANAAVDACSLVYPAGLWKIPSAADISTVTSQGLGGLLGDLSLGNVAGIDVLVGLQDALARPVEGSTVGNKYSEFTPSSGYNPAYGAATSPVNQLRFNYNGYMNTLGVLSNLITLELWNTYGSYNAFWTNENLIASPIINAGVKYHLGHTAEIPLVGERYKAYRTTSLISIGLLNSISVINSPLMNIRCVRDDTWASKSENPNYNPMPVYPQ